MEGVIENEDSAVENVKCSFVRDCERGDGQDGSRPGRPGSINGDVRRGQHTVRLRNGDSAAAIRRTCDGQGV